MGDVDQWLQRPITQNLLHFRFNLQLYKSSMLILFIAVSANIVFILLFTGFIPFIECHLTTHNEFDALKLVHCGSKKFKDESMVDLLDATASMLRTIGAKYFLNGELLLVAVRSDFAPYNHLRGDALIGILPAGLKALQTSHYSLPNRYHLAVYNSHIHSPGKRDPSVVARVVDRRTDLFIDIHEFVPGFHDDTSVHLKAVWSLSWARCQGCERRSIDSRKQFEVPWPWVMPLAPCSYRGVEATCPAQPLKLLHYYYRLPSDLVDDDDENR